jgi:hypothetical protein
MSWITNKNIQHYKDILMTAAAGPRRDVVVELLKGERDKEKLERAGRDPGPNSAPPKIPKLV